MRWRPTESESDHGKLVIVAIITLNSWTVISGLSYFAANSAGMKKDLHHLIDEVATDEHTIARAFRLLSSLKDEVDRIDPIPLPTSGTSAEDIMHFFETHSLSPEDTEDMTRFTEEFMEQE
ncbi:MAG: hypothetical protein ACYCYO_19540 [Bacilli bacterium]